MKINFIPESYIKTNHKKCIKKYIILTISLFTINIIFFNKVLYTVKKIDCINEEINSLNLKNSKKNIANSKKDKNYNLFFKVYENIDKDILVDSFDIKDGRVNLEGRCLELDNYYKLLNSLEKNKKLNIKNLDSPEKERDFYKFKFILE